MVLVLTLTCTNHVDRAKWHQMNPQEKTIYVDSLLGTEKAKDAKGGRGRTYSQPAQNYVTRIDDAYAHGDKRDPAAIFAQFADRP